MRSLSVDGRNYRPFILAALSAIIMLVLVAGVSFASEEGEHVGMNKDFVWRVVNFLILLAILYKLGWAKIKSFFAGRREEIKTALEEAVKAKEEAEKKFKEYSDRLDKATGEITQISEMIKSQGEVEKEKIIESARVSAAKMKEDSQARMEQELKSAGNLLRAEAAELSIKMAEEVIQKSVKEKDHDVMVKEFLKRMVK
jgi:F-type H+-transporting ATPase subunit b